MDPVLYKKFFDAAKDAASKTLGRMAEKGADLTDWTESGIWWEDAVEMAAVDAIYDVADVLNREIRDPMAMIVVIGPEAKKIAREAIESLQK